MSKENKRQRTVQNLIAYFCSTLCEDPINGTEFDSDVIRALEAVKRQYADNPATGYEMDEELKDLGFHPPGTLGIAGCTTIPCFGGKMPDQKLPVTGCAIGRTMCSQSPRQSMRDARAFGKMEAELEEKKRLAKNKAARELYAARKGGNRKV